MGSRFPQRIAGNRRPDEAGANLDDSLPIWSEAAVNDMADRLIMRTERTAEGRFFLPQHNTSRAEYASSLVSNKEGRKKLLLERGRKLFEFG